MSVTQVSIRDMDQELFRRFKAFSHQRGLKIGEALGVAVQHWMEEHKSKRRFLEFKPWDWGKGAENASSEIDKVVYGGA